MVNPVLTGIHSTDISVSWPVTVSINSQWGSWTNLNDVVKLSIIFHQPGFPWNSRRFPLLTTIWGPRLCEVAKIWPELWCERSQLSFNMTGMSVSRRTFQGSTSRLETMESSNIEAREERSLQLLTELKYKKSEQHEIHHRNRCLNEATAGR